MNCRFFWLQSLLPKSLYYNLGCNSYVTVYIPSCTFSTLFPAWKVARVGWMKSKVVQSKQPVNGWYIINYSDLPLFWYYLQSNQIMKDYQSCPGTIISDSSSFPPSPSSLSKSSSLSSVCTHLWSMGGGGPRDTFCPKSSRESLGYFCSYCHLPSITHHPPTTMCSRSFNQPRLWCYRISHFNGCLFVLHWENHPWTISPGLWKLLCVQKA